MLLDHKFLSGAARIAVLALLLPLILPAAVPPGAQSALRVQSISAACESVFQAAQGQIREDALLQEVRKSLSGGLDIPTPTRTPIDEFMFEDLAEKELLRRSVQAFPLPDQAGLTALAEKEYPLYKRGDQVRIVHKLNPFSVGVTSGILYEARNGVIRVGNKSIRLRDMLGITDNEREALKFDEPGTLRRREEFIQELRTSTEAKRIAWREENSAAVFAEVKKKCGEQNERMGFTYLDDEWLNENDLYQRVVSNSFNRLMAKKNFEYAQNIKHQEDVLLGQLEVRAAADRLSPPGQHISPADEINRRQQTKLARAAAEEQARQLAQQKKAEAEALLAEEKAAKQRALAEAEAARKQAELEAQGVDIKTDFQPGEVGAISPLMIAALALLIVAVLAGIIIWRRKASDEIDVAKFFVGKGRVQKEFWARVEADPEHFKYVAYMFPNLSEASSALSKLSYIFTDKDGNLNCKRELHFGVYPHQGMAVCFVGGEKLNYACWREASAVLPELPNATYFKVSTEPEVMLELPDVEALNKDSALQIISLGIEDVTNESGEFSRCFKYSAGSKEQALEFLGKSEVKEDGIVIHVETPEGIFGKDINGIFEA
ncbi:MAG: hypothetical protein GX564_03690 [Oligosphaeraceae bacterium]|nr:hypothetical protein [Oligosphaeraceae bacterium]